MQSCGWDQGFNCYLGLVFSFLLFCTVPLISVLFAACRGSSCESGQSVFQAWCRILHTESWLFPLSSPFLWWFDHRSPSNWHERGSSLLYPALSGCWNCLSSKTLLIGGKKVKLQHLIVGFRCLFPVSFKLGSEYFLNLKLLMSEVKVERQQRPFVENISTSHPLPVLVAFRWRGLDVDPCQNSVG